MSKPHSQYRGRSRSGKQGKNFSQKRKPPETSRQALKLIPLGGLEEMGKNMWAIEQEGDILVMDMGSQMPDSDQPGVDLLIPNTNYLADNVDKIRGVVFTSGNPDHIGAAPYILSMFPNLKLFATEATFSILESRHNFYSRKIQYKKHVLKDGKATRVGSFKVTPFSVGYNTPGAIGVCINTMQGKVFYVSSFKYNTEDHSEPEWMESVKYLAGSDTFALLSGSIAAEAEGYAPTEASIGEKIKEICSNPNGTTYISTHPSLINRLQQVIDAAEVLDKHVFIEGKSILNTFNTARKKGLIKVQRGTIISPSVIEETPKNKLIVLVSGAQGDDIPHLMRMANREHGSFVIEEGDVVAYPEDLVPGNMRSVQKVNDNFSKLGAHVIHYRALGLQNSTHARREEVLGLLKAVRPKYFIPSNAPHYLLRTAADMAIEGGYPDKNAIVGKNGRVILFDYKHRKMTPETVPSYDIMVDGLGVGDLKDVVIRDRQLMAGDGIVNLVLIIDEKDRKIVEGPDIVSRGFVDVDKSDRLFEEVNKNVSMIVESILADAQEVNASYIRDELRDQVGKFLFAKTERRPMILPVVVLI